MRSVATIWLAMACCVSAAGVADDNAQPGWGEALDAEVHEPWAAPQYRSFDFWIGEWEMNWRAKPEGQLHFDQEGTWTHQRVFPILGGKALVELAWDRDADAETPSGRGFSIRYYDEERDRWVMAQHWPGPGNPGIAFLDQLIGFEDNGRLSMYSTVRMPQDDGTFQVYKRQYNFADIRDGAFRWDGSNSNDEGKSWETWNVVDAGRIAELEPFGPAGRPWPGYIGGLLCTEAPHAAFDVVEGVWTGTVIRNDGEVLSARLSAGRLLDGCAVAMVLEQEQGPRVFSAASYSPRIGQWLIFSLDDLPGTGHRYSWSPTAGAGAVFHEAPSLAIADEYNPYITAKAFDSSSASRRTVWSIVSADALEFEEQIRVEPDATWLTVAAYKFERGDGEYQ